MKQDKFKQFMNTVCLTEGLSHQSKIDRTYSVLMYMIGEGKITVGAATEIMDQVKENESIKF